MINKDLSDMLWRIRLEKMSSLAYCFDDNVHCVVIGLKTVAVIASDIWLLMDSVASMIFKQEYL